MNTFSILPVGPVEPDIIDIAESCLKEKISWEFRREENVRIPANAFDEKRKQYLAVEIMRAVNLAVRNDVSRVLAVTEVDLCIPMLTFVFGQAQLHGKVALMSTARLRQEFYSLPPQRQLLQERIVKETLHEVGHTFGLIHCPTITCVMALANTVHHVDGKNSDYCGGCTRIFRDALREKEHMKNEEEL